MVQRVWVGLMQFIYFNTNIQSMYNSSSEAIHSVYAPNSNNNNNKKKKLRMQKGPSIPPANRPNDRQTYQNKCTNKHTSIIWLLPRDTILPPAMLLIHLQSHVIAYTRTQAMFDAMHITWFSLLLFRCIASHRITEPFS